MDIGVANRHVCRRPSDDLWAHCYPLSHPVIREKEGEKIKENERKKTTVLLPHKSFLSS